MVCPSFGLALHLKWVICGPLAALGGMVVDVGVVMVGGDGAVVAGGRKWQHCGGSIE